MGGIVGPGKAVWRRCMLRLCGRWAGVGHTEHVVGCVWKQDSEERLRAGKQHAVFGELQAGNTR